MASFSSSILVKNLTNAPKATCNFLSVLPSSLTLWRKIMDNRYHNAPQAFRDQVEEECLISGDRKPHTDDIWIDPDLSKFATRQDLRNLHMVKTDGWKFAAAPLMGIVGGAYSLPFVSMLLSSNCNAPQCFNETPEQLQQWYRDTDLRRYKHAPATREFLRAYLIDTIEPDPEITSVFTREGFHALHDDNTIRIKPSDVREFGNFNRDVFSWNFHTYCDAAREAGYLHNTALWGFDRIPEASYARLRDYWDIAFLEDSLVMREQSHLQMDDAELFDYAWRRFLCPVDKNFSRGQIIAKLEDYFEYLGPDFLEKSVIPEFRTHMMYMARNYCDPAYLDGNIDDLVTQDDHAELSNIAREVFLQRLEFENGPLRDQVEAHSINVMREREARLKAAGV